MADRSTIDTLTVGKGHIRFVRVPPRKARIVADLIRGKTVAEALRILKFCNRPSASKVMEQLVKNAANSVDRALHRNTDELIVSHIFVNQGPTMKRWRPRAMGRASKILKRSSHISIYLTE